MLMKLSYKSSHLNNYSKCSSFLFYFIFLFFVNNKFFLNLRCQGFDSSCQTTQDMAMVQFGYYARNWVGLNNTAMKFVFFFLNFS